MNVDKWLSYIDRIMWFLLIVSASLLVGIVAARLALFIVDLLKPILSY